MSPRRTRAQQHAPPPNRRDASRARTQGSSSCLTAHSQEVPKPKEYPFGPDSERKEGVPQGKVTKQVWKSTVFPGTIREYFVYVPAQYGPQGSEKAAVMIWNTENSRAT